MYIKKGVSAIFAKYVVVWSSYTVTMMFTFLPKQSGVEPDDTPTVEVIWSFYRFSVWNDPRKNVFYIWAAMVFFCFFLFYFY